jgi:hypothetical protein
VYEATHAEERVAYEELEGAFVGPDRPERLSLANHVHFLAKNVGAEDGSVQEPTIPHVLEGRLQELRCLADEREPKGGPRNAAMSSEFALQAWKHKPYQKDDSCAGLHGDAEHRQQLSR